MWAGLLFLYVLFITNLEASTCKNPKVVTKTYTTQDATITREIAFISEFNLECEEDTPGSLYAEINGEIHQVMKIGGPSSYQVSWTEETKKARAGEYKINLYDEESYNALRKTWLMGDDPQSIKPLVTFALYYPGAYQGPWVNSEFLAAVIGSVVYYFAFTSKSKLIS